jgi:Zn-dependent metalloprotease
MQAIFLWTWFSLLCLPGLPQDHQANTMSKLKSLAPQIKIVRSQTQNEHISLISQINLTFKGENIQEKASAFLSQYAPLFSPLLQFKIGDIQHSKQRHVVDVKAMIDGLEVINQGLKLAFNDQNQLILISNGLEYPKSWTPITLGSDRAVQIVAKHFGIQASSNQRTVSLKAKPVALISKYTAKGVYEIIVPSASLKDQKKVLVDGTSGEILLVQSLVWR